MKLNENICLSIETATEKGSLAIMHADRVLAQWRGESKISHSIELINQIDSLFQQADISPKSLNYLVVTNGPGSFTGLRVGIATAKAMALGLKISLIGVNTLSAMSLAVKGPQTLYGLVEAAGNQIFCQKFRQNRKTDYQAEGETFIAHYQKFFESIKNLEDSTLVVTNKVYKHIKENKNLSAGAFKIENIEEDHVLAVYSGLKAGQLRKLSGGDWPTVIPNYLQPPIVKKPN